MSDRSCRTALRWGMLIGLWLVPATTVAVAIPLSARMTGDAVQAPPPTTVRVGSRTDDFRTPVAATAVFDAPRSVHSSGSGLVTSLNLTQGAEVDPGALLFELDGVPVRAFVESVPLHRDLRRGDRGDDVLALGRFLQRTGHLRTAPASTVGPATDLAIRRYAASIGRQPDGLFRSAWTLFVPADATTVGTVATNVGDRLSDGDVVFTGRPPIRSLEFASETSMTRRLAAGPMIMRLGERDHHLSALQPTGAERDAVFGALEAARERGDVTATDDANEPGAARRYEGVTLRLQNPITSGSAPASAVVSGPSGALCVYRDQTHPVRVNRAEITSALGSIAVSADLVGKRILRDPSVVSGTTPCG